MKIAAKKNVPMDLVKLAIFLDIRLRSKIFSQDEKARLIELGLLDAEECAVRELAAMASEPRIRTISPLEITDPPGAHPK